ncbi:MAG: hypothetical protein KC496_19305 [Anaerolineae bacterium]|nr:hypothetical protein [Anaerolineae bacterium]
MVFLPLQHPKATARYDEETGIIYVSYTGLLDGETSTAVYNWLGDLTDAIGIEQLRGEVFDFREVTEFMPDNLMEARRNSRRYNLRNDIKRLPVTMIVKDFYQEEILRGPMQNVKENQRKTVVWSPEEALSFIQSWHEDRSAEDDSEE